MQKTLIVIPCRYQSSRLLKKHLIEFSNGKTLFQMTYEQCLKTKADKIIIATDHKDIYDKAKTIGAEVEMTKSTHSSGTDRVAEVANRHPSYNIILNVQGDEPLIDPEIIDQLIAKKIADTETPVYSAMTPFLTRAAAENPNNVKVVVSQNQYALYFSRATIPYQKNKLQTPDEFGYKHLGIYAFKRDFLLKFTQLAKTPLEYCESLEQLRVLEQGYKIGMLKIADDALGVDEQADVIELERLLKNR